jgi:hypothetical protein
MKEETREWTLAPKWTRPELIIITRHKTEESVLASCKGGTKDGSGFYNNYCKGPIEDCTNCDAIAIS